MIHMRVEVSNDLERQLKKYYQPRFWLSRAKYELDFNILSKQIEIAFKELFESTYPNMLKHFYIGQTSQNQYGAGISIKPITEEGRYWYYGTTPHMIFPRTASILVFEAEDNGGGSGTHTVFAHFVEHPGQASHYEEVVAVGRAALYKALSSMPKLSKNFRNYGSMEAAALPHTTRQPRARI